jgi:hypothetical protein
MKIKLLFLNLFLFLFYHNSFGQEETTQPKNQLEFSTGYNFGALKNLEYAPVSRYDYRGLVYKLNYKRETRKQNLFEVQLDHLNSELETDIIPVLNLDYSKTRLGFSYLKKTYAKNNFLLYLGLHSQSNVSIYSKNSNYRSVIDQAFGVASRFSYQINEKQSFSSKLIIPVVLLRLTDSNADIYSLNRNQSILWNSGYNYSLSNQFDMKLSYEFNYDRLQISNAFRELQHQISLSINYKF